MGCQSCSQPVPEGARFCPFCGVPLSVQLLPVPAVADIHTDEERRVVTVLFADIVSFTSMAEHRDPEQVKRLVDAAFALLVADVEAHGGVVDKVLGDAIIALFGAPIAHEDDADRAVRAGLAMQSTLRDFRDEHPADELRIRVGVNTGEVLVGTLAGTEYTAMGDVVNTASRLQSLAPPGAVLVGDATKVLCSPTLRFRPYDEVRLRGRDRTEQVWQAVAHDAALLTRRWQSDVPLVGRTTELGVLRNLASISHGGHSAIVSVTGEPGIGKSRVVHEVVAELIAAQPETLLLEGICAPYGEPNQLWPLAGGLLARLGLDRSCPADEARRRVVRRLQPFPEMLPGSPEFGLAVEVVMHLLGHPSALDELGPAATRDTVFATLVEGMRRRSEKSPVIVWIDDLQWAAPVLLEMLESVARALEHHPVLIVVTYRRTDDGLADWPSSVEPALTLHLPLTPLSEAEAAELARVAAGKELPEKLVRSISARAGGNPLFIIELARLTADGPDGAHFPELPGSLRALIAARLDQLSPMQRALLDNASILGFEGRILALREFAGELGQPYDPDDIDGLVEAGLIVRDGGRWQFRSDVVREVAYGMLTKQARAQRHAGVGRHMERYGDGAIEMRAHHLASAAELVGEIGHVQGVSREIAQRAAEELMQAARRAYHQGAYRRGQQFVERALALRPPPELRLQATLLLAELLVDMHDLPAARDAVDEVFQLAEAADDRLARADAYRLRGTVAQTVGDLVGARRDLGHAVSEFRDLGDEPRLGEALRARGFAEVFGGSLADAEWFLGEADAIFERIRSQRGRAWVLQHLAWVSFLSGDHASSELRLAAAIRAFEQLGDRGGVNWSRGLLAYVRHFARRTADAEQLAAGVYEESRRYGDEWGASMMLNLRASIRLWSGEIEEARVLAEKALVGFRRIEDQFGMVQTLATLNRVLVAAGRTSDADRGVEELLALAGSFGPMSFPSMAAAGASMHAGDGERAARLATEALGRLDTTGVNVDEAHVVLAFGLLQTGAVDDALATLLEVEVDASPFALAARATAHAALGDGDAALRDVRVIEALAAQPESNVSYWDLWVARVAGIVAASDDDACDRIADLRLAAESLGDVVLRAYACDVLSRLCPGGDGPPPCAPRGWGALAELIVARSTGGAS
jgi:class 3 adenylate cyclase/tetratricopeptide (TPR) repeat protein